MRIALWSRHREIHVKEAAEPRPRFLRGPTRLPSSQRAFSMRALPGAYVRSHPSTLEPPMQLNDILAQTGGLSSIARELGISEQQVQAGAAALLPAILGGFAKQAQPAGAGGIGDLLSQLGGGGLLDDVVSPQPTNVG